MRVAVPAGCVVPPVLVTDSVTDWVRPAVKPEMPVVRLTLTTAGVGGGVVMVPRLVLWLRASRRDAHALSLAAIIPIAAVGVTGYALADEVDYGVAAALALGSIAGARAGAGLLTRLSERRLKALFGCLLLGVAASMVLH